MLKLLLITKCNQNRDNERGLAKKKKKKKVLLDLKMIAVKDIMRGYEHGKMVIIIHPLKCCHKEEKSCV